MKFIDTAKIIIRSGKGGPGMVSFRREKYVPKGGPDGGNGGKGGDVVFQTDSHMNTLLDFKYKRHFFAENGAPGGTKKMFGKNGADMVIKVPCGTIIKNAETGEMTFLATRSEFRSHAHKESIVHRYSATNIATDKTLNRTPLSQQTTRQTEQTHHQTIK